MQPLRISVKPLTMLVTSGGQWLLPDSTEFLAILGDPDPDYDAIAFAIKISASSNFNHSATR